MDTRIPNRDGDGFWTRITGYQLGQYGQRISWRRLSFDGVRHLGGAYLRHFPERIRRIWRHFLSAARGGASWLVSIPGHPKRFLLWLKDGVMGTLAWTGRAVSKTFDLLGMAEAWDLAGQLVKPRTRSLNPMERAEARLVFGDILNYDKVRIDERSLIARLGRRLLKFNGLGIVLGHTVHFNRSIYPTPGNSEMTWLIHELVHVLQCQVAGLQYIGEAVAAQLGAGYEYGGPKGVDGKSLREFNREQQGDIVADFYRNVIYGEESPDPYLRAISDLRSGRL